MGALAGLWAWLLKGLPTVLSLLLGALSDYASKRADAATTTAATRDDAVQTAANETATVVEETADARSQIVPPSDAGDLVAQLRNRAKGLAAAGGGGGAGDSAGNHPQG